MKLQWKALVVFALALLLCGCGTVQENPTEPTKTLPPPTPGQRYAMARDAFQNENNMILTYTLTETREVNGMSYTRDLAGNFSVSNRGKEDMLAVTKETLQYGNSQFGYMEMYRGGSTYLQINESGFSSASTPQEFLERQMLFALVDESLYGSVNTASGENTSIINFNEPTALEKWLPCSEGAELISAGASAKLNGMEQLLGTTYRAEYVNSGVRFTVVAEVHCTAPASLELGVSMPDHINVVGVLDDIDAPKMLLQTVGAVYSAKNINCDVTETIQSEAIPLEHIQKSRYTLTGSGKTLVAEAIHETSLSDDRGHTSIKTQVDTFREGVFTTATDGEEPTVQSQVTAETVRQGFEDAVLSAVFAPKYVLNASIEDCGAYYQLQFNGNSEFKKDLMVGITAFLEVDLDAEAENIQDVEATGYLTVDKATGLPTAMGLKLERIHTLATAEHRLIYRLEQILSLLPVAG